MVSPALVQRSGSASLTLIASPRSSPSHVCPGGCVCVPPSRLGPQLSFTLMLGQGRPSGNAETEAPEGKRGARGWR